MLFSGISADGLLKYSPGTATYYLVYVNWSANVLIYLRCVCAAPPHVVSFIYKPYPLTAADYNVIYNYSVHALCSIIYHCQVEKVRLRF